MKVAFPLLKVYKVGKNSSVNITFKDKKLIGEGNAYSWYVSGGYVGGARKWAEKEATAVKIAELVALF